MMVIETLGVFESIYGADAYMTISRALLISFVGFGIVFLILGILALFVKAMGKGFDAANAKKQMSIPAAAVNVPSAAPAPVGAPLPADTSAGTLKLIDVTEEEAAVIMAITSHQSGIPLNRLQFNSIKPADEVKKETKKK